MKSLFRFPLAVCLAAAAAVAAFALQATGLVDVAAAFHAVISPEVAMGLAGAAGTTRYLQRGVVMDWATGGSALVSGQMVAVGTGRVGITLGAIAANSTGAVQVAGVFTYPKLSTDVVTVGALLYFDSASNRLTLTSAGNTLAGSAFAAAGNGVTSVQVLLNNTPG